MTMKKRMNKKAQEVLGMSFSMIFSILLIIAFLAVAIYAIIYFISFKNCSLQSIFINDLKEDVNTVWNSASKSQDFSRNLPTGIQQFCFIDFSKSINNLDEVYDDLKRYEGKDANLFLYPSKKAYCRLAYYKIEHIDLEKITELKNPYCIENNGKPVLKLSKGIYDALVKIE